jgi:hypothetical protein
MQSKREREKTGREKLVRIIETCKSVEQRSLDPFLINIDDNIKTAREYLPEWTLPEDLCLDAETIHHIATVVKLQSEWVKHRSTSLYTDPFLLEEKLKKLSKGAITGIFVKAWHPLIEFEQVTLHSLAEAINYWMNLLPLNERWKETPPIEVKIGSATREELVQQRILQDKTFSEELNSFWQELKTCVQKKGSEGKVHYWDFVGADTYEETVQRAFMASFLITYGYATLEVRMLEEEMFIKPNEKPETRISAKQLVSIPIPVSVEEWKRWKKGEQQ